MPFDGSILTVYCYTREISYMLVRTGQLVEQCRLPTVLITCQGKSQHFSLRQGMLICFDMIFAALTQARMLYILLHVFLMIGRIYIIWLSCILYLYLLCICQTKRQFVSMYL